MSNTVKHPSYFDLDCYALGERAASIDSHLNGCEQCQAYLLRTKPTEEAMPNWVPSFSKNHPRRERQKPRTKRVWLWPSMLLAGVTALVLLMMPTTSDAPSAGVYEKGLPAVTVFVKRGEQVVAWQEDVALAFGDQVRLQVAPASASYVTVLSCPNDRVQIQTNTQPRILHAGAVVPKKTAFLPVAWQLDAASEPEILTVVFSDAVVAMPKLRKVCQGDVVSGIYTLALTLRKQPVGSKIGARNE